MITIITMITMITRALCRKYSHFHEGCLPAFDKETSWSLLVDSKSVSEVYPRRYPIQVFANLMDIADDVLI